MRLWGFTGLRYQLKYGRRKKKPGIEKGAQEINIGKKTILQMF